MVQTGTYSFGLSGGDLTLECYDRLQIRAPELTIDHMQSIKFSMNLIQSRWTNRGVNLWEITEVTIPLVQGTATYAIDAATVFLAPEVFLRSNPNTSAVSDIILFPLSRADYASIPVKTTQGRPTSYWFDRLISPTITLWPVPDGSAPYEAHYYKAAQQQDMTPQIAVSPDIPFRFQEAYAAEIAAHLAMKWRPESWEKLTAYAKECWQEAAGEDREKVSWWIAPDFSGYFGGGT
jgi:hypothetical protein